MNRNVAKKIFMVIFLVVGMCAVVVFSGQNDQNALELLDRVETALARKDVEAYLELFVPEKRAEEKNSLQEKFERFNLDHVAVFKTRRQVMTENGVSTDLNVMFENENSVVIEGWRLDLEKSSGEWRIRKKDVTRKVQNLYKIHIPSGREERASRVDIRHADIQITFHDPIVFYDNLPDVETALLVIGEGELRFNPSLPRERHQLELVYKKGFLRDRVRYAYVRCSNSQFEESIRIEKRQNETPPIDQSERNRAYSLFAAHYPRSFTVENSLNGGLLSILPQGEETVIEFEGEKIGKHTYIFSPFSEEEVTLYQWEKKRFLNIYSPREVEGEKRFFISFGEKFDVLRYTMDIDFEPDDSYISGKAKIVLESNKGNLDKVKLKLNPELEILRITDESDNELFFTKDKLRRNLYVYFIDPIMRDHEAAIIIYYRGTILPTHVAEDSLSIGQIDDLYLYIPPRSDTYLYSLNAEWYPVPPVGDYFTARIRIIVPPGFTAVSNGLLVEESSLQQSDKVEELDNAGRKVFVFESHKPIKYMSFLVGRLTMKGQETAPLPLSYFRTIDVILPRMDSLQESKDILRFYEEKFGAYPFESLSVIQRIWQESGGHSPASFVVLNHLPRIEGVRLRGSASPVNLTRWNEYYLAHEIAHQWWGQGVTWERYQDQWISEGLAQFSTILYLREKHGEMAFSNILKKMAAWTEKKTKWGPIIFGSRISHFDFPAFQTIVYDKTSLAMNMLKDMLGQDVFFQGIKEFFARFKYRAARTEDFVAVLSDVSKKDLKPFFDVWFRSFELPDVKVDRSISREEGAFRLKFRVFQNKEPFVFPLWVEWVENNKNIRKMMIVDKKEQTFQFDLAHKPDRIRINPDSAVPGKFR